LCRRVQFESRSRPTEKANRLIRLRAGGALWRRDECPLHRQETLTHPKRLPASSRRVFLGHHTFALFISPHWKRPIWPPRRPAFLYIGSFG
jgi:hypothetical protein